MLTCALGTAVADPAPPVAVPPGTRTIDGQLISGRGFRDTVEAIAKEIARRGLLVTTIGPYQVRGVDVVRFVSTSPSTPWLAIHVSQVHARVVIAFVPRPT